jgi:hypothetical protein
MLQKKGGFSDFSAHIVTAITQPHRGKKNGVVEWWSDGAVSTPFIEYRTPINLRICFGFPLTSILSLAGERRRDGGCQ